MYHNHLEKDYSYPWAHEPELDAPGPRLLHQKTLLMGSIRAFVFPWIAYAFYLAAPEYLFGARFGIDGSHFMPFEKISGKLWKNASKQEVTGAVVSNIFILSYVVGWTYFLYDGSFVLFCTLFLPCWLVFCFCLFAVTYLQHHGVNTKVYDDSTWSYTTAAFETVDRDYGSLVNLLHHHISDCHVVHHLFFTKIPHYNLKKATCALEVHLTKCNLRHLYKTEVSLDWPVLLMRLMWDVGMRVVLVTKDRASYFARAGKKLN
jgi:omega-3 fatty acid desaturase (delta-15 desaturase)